MKKEFRLRRSMDFKKVFKEGKRISSPRFALYMYKNMLSQTRIGISISKSHFKLATRRNRLRRIAKELFRKTIHPYFEGYDFVIASKASYLKPDINEAIKEMRCLVSRVNE